MFQFQLPLDVIPSRVSLPDVTSGEWVSRGGVPYQSHDACYIPTHPPPPPSNRDTPVKTLAFRNFVGRR